jgi:hypothetical protein
MKEVHMSKAIKISLISLMVLFITYTAAADRRTQLANLAQGLEQQATHLAQSNYEHFKGWNQTISDQEQAVLFKSEAFASSCRLFLKLTSEQSGYFRSGYLRTSLYNAFIFLTNAFDELDKEMQKAGIMPYEMRDIKRTLERMDYEFSYWPASDNLAYLHQKYVKARDASVYMIERKGPGKYMLHAFKNLESIFRYNYDINRGKDPWKYLAEVPYDTLRKMEEGPMIDLSFEGLLVIENSTRLNRSVYLIERGKKRGITSPRVLERYGGWSNVFEIPAEIIATYQEGEPIK